MGGCGLVGAGVVAPEAVRNNIERRSITTLLRKTINQALKKKHTHT